MSLRPRLVEETPFTLQFDDELIDRSTIFTTELAWGADPMETLMRKQEIERDELIAYLTENTKPSRVIKRRKAMH